MPLTNHQQAQLVDIVQVLEGAGANLDELADETLGTAAPESESLGDARDMISTARAMLAALSRAEPGDPAEPDGRPDWQIYLDRYDDVRAAGPYTEDWARRHFENWGRDEGRTWGRVDRVERKRFHHYNASAWHDRGVAVILCPGESAQSARIGGRRLKKHGNKDKGREVWADYHRRGLTGTLELVIGGVAYTAEITDASGMTEGDCWSRG